MFAIPFGRIFWKEYRVHRGLWLSCFLIGCLFQILLWWSILDPTARADTLPGGAVYFSVMYAVGCGALLFAGEREDRTSEWLLSLAVPPGPTLGAKFGFAVISTLALQLFLALLSLVLLQGTPYSLANLFVPFALTVLVWSALGSLFSQRVMTSIPVMAFLCLFPHLALLFCFGRMLGQNGRSDAEVWVGVVVLSCCAFGLDCWIGWRWCQGKYLAGGQLQNFYAGVRRKWGHLDLRTTVTSRIPVCAEYEQSWRRTWQRLIWQERHRNSFHRLILISGGLLALFLSIGGLVLRNPTDRNALTLLFLGLMIPIPLVMGIMGFRSDASFHQLRFLAHRGVSPGSVWLAKHAVWLTRAFWLPFVLIAIAWIFDSLLDPPAVAQTGRSPFQNFFTVISLRQGLFVWFVLLGYGSGQLASLLFQRTVLALTFGVLLNLVLIFWYGMMDAYLEVPEWWSLGLPVFAMLALTLWQMKPWLLENGSWSRRWKLASALIAIPACLVALLAYHRVAEASRPLPIDPGLAQMLNSSAAVTRSVIAGDESKRLRLQALSQVAFNQDVANEVVEILKDDSISLLPAYPLEVQTFKFSDRLRDILCRQANFYCGIDLLDKALECHLANLRLSRSLSMGGPYYSWLFASHTQGFTLEDLVAWANHPAQTPESIRSAIKLIEAELAKFPSATGPIAKSYADDRRTWILSSRAEMIEELTRLKAFEYSSVGWLPAFLPWERKRADLLMTRDAQLRLAAVWSLETRLATPKTMANQSVSRDFNAIANANEKLNSTTAISHFTNSPLSGILGSVLNHHTNLRAAIIRMELIAYRLERGTLPNRLIELMPSMNGVLLVDPWSGRLFDYDPSFLMSSGRNHLQLIPGNGTDVELMFDGNSLSENRYRFSQLRTGTAREIQQRLKELKQMGDVSQYLFPIPPPMSSDIRF